MTSSSELCNEKKKNPADIHNRKKTTLLMSILSEDFNESSVIKRFGRESVINNTSESPNRIIINIFNLIAEFSCLRATKNNILSPVKIITVIR